MRAHKKASFLQLVFMIYGAVCAGAFGLEDMISKSGPGAALLTLAVMPFLFSLPIAYAVGELTAAFPVEGGNYRWSRMAFGDFWGFQAGWWAWMTGVVLNSLFAVLFTDYLKNWFPDLNGIQHWFISLALIWSLHYLNVRGIAAVGNAAIALSLVLLAPFVILTLLGTASWQHNPFSPFFAPGKDALASFGNAAVLAIWLYSGFDKLSATAEEVENPQRNFPPALLCAAIMAMLSYLLPTLAALAAQGEWQNWSGAYFPTAAEKIGGPWLGSAMLIGALCSNALLLNVTMLSVSRVPLAMAQDGLLPGSFARLHPNFGTPTTALVLGSVIYSLFSVLDFTQLTIIYAWFQMASYILLYINALALRRAYPTTPRPFKIPLGRPGLVGALGITCALALLAVFSSVFEEGHFATKQAVIGLLALASGPVAYRVFAGSTLKTRTG